MKTQLIRPCDGQLHPYPHYRRNLASLSSAGYQGSFYGAFKTVGPLGSVIQPALVFSALRVVVYWSWLLSAGSSLLEPMWASFANSAFSDVTLVAWNQPYWEYLYHGNEQMLEVRSPSDPSHPSQLLHIYQNTSDGDRAIQLYDNYSGLITQSNEIGLN